MLLSNPRWWPARSAIFRYGAAVMSVTAALIIAWWMEFVRQSAAHVSLFLCAVMFSAWFGGIRPGLLAIALSVLAFDYYFWLWKLSNCRAFSCLRCQPFLLRR